jgi:hypothetical protein
MHADQVALDRAARLCDQAGDEARRADQQLHYGNVAAAREHLTTVDQAAQEALRLLLQAGATRPANVPPRRADADPLRAMAQADTPATRRLLAAVRAAVDAAEEVDAERGNVLPAHLPLQPGESRGTGWAESISNLAERLRVEVEGPTDRRQEGRRG